MPTASEVTRHLVRHRALYLLAVAWLGLVLIFPTLPVADVRDADLVLPPEAGGHDQADGVAPPGAQGVEGGVPGAGEPGGAVPSSVGAAPGGQAAAASGATPLTRGGVPCRPGVKQVAHASYSPPCAPAFVGNNGGATARGVSATEIKVLVRYFDDNPALNGPPDAATRKVRQVFVDHLNDTMELYGRRVVIEYVRAAAGSSIEEMQGRGRDGACQDAAEYAQERKAFGILQSESTPFLDCAAEQGLVVFEAMGRQSERLMSRRHPYLWTSQRGCERLADHLVEYAGKRLVGRKASLAGPAERGKQRKLGVYVPDNETYQPCLEEALGTLESRYGHRAERFEYTPDLPRLADQAALAVARFKSAGVTTVALTCDDLSIPLLMAAADSNDWQPEWLLSGVGSQGVDAVARSWPEQQRIHVFGLSEFPVDTTFYSRANEPAAVYKALTGEQLAYAHYTIWAELQQLFRLLQAAGPRLTPQSLGTGALSLPEARGYQGRWSYRLGPRGQPGAPSHGAIIDATELYWDDAAPSLDGERGAFRAAQGGAWFASGQWPASEVQRG